MGFWDHVPIVGTVKRALSHWSGGDIGDYNSCAVLPTDCENLGKTIAEENCRNCINRLKTKYIKELPGPSIVKSLTEGVAGVTITALGQSLLKGGTTALGKALTGVGVVLIVDDLVDLGIYLYRVLSIGTATNKAIKSFCKCESNT